LGVAGEAGEVCEKVKKVLRDKNGAFDNEAIEAIMLELGDLLWYVAALASELGSNLEMVAVLNLLKLEDRKERGKLHGSGDSR
jgi:NTP pyrophosphatase (non-canonical NTP hydrolase)